MYEIDTLNQNLTDILREIEIESERVAHGKAKLSLLDKVENGRLKVQQGIIAGCSGGNYENVIAAANALRGQSCGMTPSRWQFTRHHSRCLWISPKKVW
ncbi:hypothetical protein D3W53_16930 [Escherichia coli]|nr:hypothetical protein D3W53_16930 [Escherichia coli]